LANLFLCLISNIYDVVNGKYK